MEETERGPGGRVKIRMTSSSNNDRRWWCDDRRGGWRRRPPRPPPADIDSSSIRIGRDRRHHQFRAAVSRTRSPDKNNTDAAETSSPAAPLLHRIIVVGRF